MKYVSVENNTTSDREKDNLNLFQFCEQPPITLASNAFLNRQAQRESNARSYPRRFPIAIAKAKGIYIEDTAGQVFIDCLAGAGTLALGHNHPSVHQALRDYLDSNAPLHTLDITTPAKDAFIQQLFDSLPPAFAHSARVQFCGPTGADAVEAAIKLVKTATGRRTVLAFNGAYHGMTHATLSLMGNLATKAPINNLMPEVQFLPYPNLYRCPFGLSGEQSITSNLHYIENLLNDPQSGVLPPAAVIVEAIQGESGVVTAPVRWLKGLRNITRKHGIPLILDEVQCGIGRSGKMFAFEHADIIPDVIVISKAIGGGLPLSVIVYDKALDTWAPGAHTGTFRGNQLAMVAGRVTLQTILDQRLCEQAAAKSREWELHFASCGDQALEIVASCNISVIVSDMRMPGMDGASVLEKVSELSPHTIRFVLSGQARSDLILRVIPYAHIFLAKPCSQDLLLEVLERACTLQALLANPEIRKIVTRMGRLPSMPALFDQLRNEFNANDVSSERIGEIMASDPGMCSKILQVVNSAFFGSPRRVSTAQEAVGILGLATVSSMVQVSEVFYEVDRALAERFQFENKWDHLNRTSLISKAIAEFEGLSKEKINSATTAGLLHEVGRLMVASNAPELYQQVIDKVENGGMNFEQAELDVYQATSADIGAYLLGLWGLPDDVIRGVAYHRHPAKDARGDDRVTTAAIVHVANSFDRCNGQTSRSMEEYFDTSSLSELHIVDKLPKWQKVARSVLGNG